MKKFLLIIILNLILNSLAFSKSIEVNTLFNDKKNYEKMEMLFGDYRIYTHRPGAVKIRRISDNKQLVVFSDKFKVKFYNNGDRIFDFILDEDKENISIKFRDLELFTWKGKYVSKHRAYFYQILTYDNQPFHYYIKLLGKQSSAINMEKFETKISKAISKAKIQIAAKYNMTPELIDLILKKRKQTTDKKLEAIIKQEKENIEKQVDNEIDKTLQASLSDEVAKQIEDTIGQEIAKEFDSIIIDGMEAEFASIVDEAVEEAINQGISQATAEAAIRAIMDVLAAGGTEEEAMNACRSVAGSACD